MKRAICILLCVLTAVTALAACGGTEKGTKILVIDEFSRDSMTASFKDTDSGETMQAEMKKSGTGAEHTEFVCGGDPDKYDRLVLTSGGDSTIELSYNYYTDGWVLGSGRFYLYGTGYGEPTFKRVSFDYENRTKDVLIWVPESYRADSAEKYSVIYMTDGQNLFSRSATSTGSWGVAESVCGMMAQGEEQCIIVGIENADSWRDSELTPNIGEVTEDSYKNGKGEYFSDFVVDTVMPYINENYNVYTDREHTHIAGSSSGGIESFYIAMEHPDKFASVGALSPAFVLFSDETWTEYLGGKDFSAGYPTVYLYCGDSSADMLEQTLCVNTRTMPGNLRKIGYPEDKITVKIYDDGMHNEMYWRAVFPDYLKYAFPYQPGSEQ